MKRSQPYETSAVEVQCIYNISADVCSEVFAAIETHKSMNSPHEGWAVIKEEMDELWKHIMNDTALGPEARQEAIQVAAMAVRYIHDLIDWRPDDENYDCC